MLVLAPSRQILCVVDDTVSRTTMLIEQLDEQLSNAIGILAEELVSLVAAGVRQKWKVQEVQGCLS